jgi:hypothetical protein
LAFIEKQDSELILRQTIDKEEKECYDRRDKFCSFNENGKKGSVFLVGDSLPGLFKKPLKNKLVEEDFNLVIMTNGECIYVPDFNQYLKRNKKPKSCDSKLQEKRRLGILSKPDSIVVLSGRWPVYFLENGFDNQEGWKDQTHDFWRGEKFEWDSYYEPANHNEETSQTQRQQMLSEGIVSSIHKLLDNGHKIIIVYTIPEMAWSVLARLRLLSFNPANKLFEKTYISVSYDVYQQRNKSVFQVFDSIEHPNLYRVYPHKLFCNKQIENRCVAHYGKEIFYSDATHLSTTGAEMITELIMDEIKKMNPVENNSN